MGGDPFEMVVGKCGWGLRLVGAGGRAGAWPQVVLGSGWVLTKYLRPPSPPPNRRAAVRFEVAPHTATANLALSLFARAP
eukprot:scaffold19009_cov98-Isochrysis_galbana.AAC.10